MTILLQIAVATSMGAKKSNERNNQKVWVKMKMRRFSQWPARGTKTREKQTEKKLTSSYHRKCKSSLKEKSLPSSCRRCADVGIIVGLHTLSPRNDERKNDAAPIYKTTEETIQTEANVDLLTPLSFITGAQLARPPVQQRAEALDP